LPVFVAIPQLIAPAGPDGLGSLIPIWSHRVTERIANSVLDNADRLLPWALPAFVLLTWFGGGATVDVTATDEWLQLLALPVLALALIPLVLDPPRARLTHAALLAALCVMLVPVLQLLSVPAGLWAMPTAREVLTEEMGAAGALVPGRWSMNPEATLRSLLAMLPALACFLGVVALGPGRLQRLPPILLALVLANLGFGLVQAGLPDASPLRLYPGVGSGFGGVLVNGNHQGTALVVGTLLALGLWAQARQRVRNGQAARLRDRAWPLAAAVCLAAIPLSGSRAAMVIGLVAAALTAVASGLLPLRKLRTSPRAAAGAGLALALVVLGMFSAWRWVEVDALEESRQAMARETVAIAQRHVPLGSGVGTFVDVFAQEASPDFRMGEYVNHAHNEYAQWWLEGGLAALLAVVLAFAVIGWAGVLLARRGRSHPVAAASWLALLAVLAHSLVDFPLRTISVMSLSATLAGLTIVLTAAARAAHRPQRELAPSA
jgi:O-antigen ligase